MESTRGEFDAPRRPEPRPLEPRPQAQLGAWRLGRRLGKGGMGAVYEGIHVQTGERRAVKTLLAAPGAQYFEEDLARFRREAELVTRLAHPHVVRVLEANLQHQPPFLVMELLTGGTLRDLLREGPLSVGRALTLTRKLCDAVSHAHEQGALHRDLKPQNVLFDAEGEPKLADFGLGRDMGVSVERLTQTGEVLGTPAYMAPEQTVDARHVDARTDVYGLGALLYSMLAGRPPFARDGVFELLGAVRNQAPDPLRSLRDDVPLEVEAICQRAMAKDPDDRYPTAQALGMALIQATRRAAKAPDAPDAPDAPATRGKSPALAAGALLLAGVVGAVAVLGGAGDPAATPPARAGSETSPPEASPTAPDSSPVAAVDPAGRGEPRTTWALPKDAFDYTLTVSPRHPEAHGLQRASLELLLRLRVYVWPTDGVELATLRAEILRVRAWADPAAPKADERSLRYDSIWSPKVEGLSGVAGGEFRFDLLPQTGAASRVEGLPLPNLEGTPSSWPAETLRWLTSPEGFTACWNTLACLEAPERDLGVELSDLRVEQSALGQVTHAEGRPAVALATDDQGRVLRLAQATVRQIPPGGTLVEIDHPGSASDTPKDHSAFRMLATVRLANRVLNPDLVEAGWFVTLPAEVRFVEADRVVQAASALALRAAPWGALVETLEPGVGLGLSNRIVAGFRMVCYEGAVAWVAADAPVLPDSHMVVQVVSDQAYVYPDVKRVPGTGLGVLPQGHLAIVLDTAPLDRFGRPEPRLQVRYLGRTGWILAEDTRRWP